MNSTITDVPGIKVGHATDIEGGTGCTVILCGEKTVVGSDVRGSAPGTREIPLTEPVNLVQYANAIYLGGGSAYGLDGAGGVMQFLEEKRIGFDVGVGVVPIVPGAVLFDLPVGRTDRRPDRSMGYRACLDASSDKVPEGNVGAGTGASVGKARGMEFAMKGGLGSFSMTAGNLIVGAIVAVNCLGDVIDHRTGKIIAGTLSDDKKSFANSLKVLKEISEMQSRKEESKVSEKQGEVGFPGNTTIGVVATNAKLDKAGTKKVAMMAHDGLARSINPIHTMFDGDTIFALSTGEVEADLTTVGSLAAEALAIAVNRAVMEAEAAYGLLSYRDIKNI